MKKLILSLFLLSMIASPVLAEDIHLNNTIEQIQGQLENIDMPSVDAMHEEDHMDSHVEEDIEIEPEGIEEEVEFEEESNEDDF